MPGGILGGALKGIPRSPPSCRPRRRAKPSLRANSASTEHQLPPAPTTLARAGPGGEMVSRVQAKFVKQGVRESGPITRCADEDAAPVLGESSPPQRAHRLLMVGKGGGGDSMTSIDRNSITIKRVNPAEIGSDLRAKAKKGSRANREQGHQPNGVRYQEE